MSRPLIEIPRPKIPLDFEVFSFNGNMALKKEEPPESHPLERYKNDWLLFAKEWLGINTEPWPDDMPPPEWDGTNIPLWSKQVEIIKAMQVHKKVCVKSGNAVGKTFTAGLLAEIMFHVLMAIGLTTAPTFRQVRRALWGEIHKIHNKAEALLEKKGLSLGGQLNQTSLEMSGKWFMEGFSTDKPTNFLGFHKKRIFLIIDEACMVVKELWDQIESILTSEESYVLAIGNPIDPTSPFKDLFNSGSGFYPISINCYESPNVRHGRNIYPALVSCDWPERMKEKWGEDHPFYLSRVLAEFPEESPDALVPWTYLRKALDKGESLKAKDHGRCVSIGVDVARKGDDRTEQIARYGDGFTEIIAETTKESETQTATRVKGSINQYKPLCVNVDDIGVGGGVVDILVDENLPIPVNGINVSEACAKWWDDYELFLNKRAFYFWKVRKAIMSGELFFTDEEMGDEIHKLKVLYVNGKIKIMAKDDYKKLYGKSPDKADALMLAWSEDEGWSVDHAEGMALPMKFL